MRGSFTTFSLLSICQDGWWHVWRWILYSSLLPQRDNWNFAHVTSNYSQSRPHLPRQPQANEKLSASIDWIRNTLFFTIITHSREKEVFLITFSFFFSFSPLIQSKIEICSTHSAQLVLSSSALSDPDPFHWRVSRRQFRNSHTPCLIGFIHGEEDKRKRKIVGLLNRLDYFVNCTPK